MLCNLLRRFPFTDFCAHIDNNGFFSSGTKVVFGVWKTLVKGITWILILNCFRVRFSGIFDVLAYTDMDVTVPFTWTKSDPKLIANPQMVKLHSFDTKIHKVDTLVSYKNDEWDEQ
ncbi:mitotic spindle checkpoint protein MAD2 [Helianthus annuus]|nr:mitotic spindle checkpoint protein MAD2 [Helianthus annuus]